MCFALLPERRRARSLLDEFGDGLETITFDNRRPAPQSRFPLGPTALGGTPSPVGPPTRRGVTPPVALGTSDPGYPPLGIRPSEQQLLVVPTPRPRTVMRGTPGGTPSALRVLIR